MFISLVVLCLSLVLSLSLSLSHKSSQHTLGRNQRVSRRLILLERLSFCLRSLTHQYHTVSIESLHRRERRKERESERRSRQKRTNGNKEDVRDNNAIRTKN